MREIKDAIKRHARSVSLTTAGVALLLTFVLPSMFDLIMLALVFGCGYLLGRAD